MDGYYEYKKSEKNIDPNLINKKILLFNCKDKNYDRYLYLLKDKEFVNLFDFTDDEKKANLKFVRYLDADMLVKIGVISKKRINIGDKFILF